MLYNEKSGPRAASMIDPACFETEIGTSEALTAGRKVDR